MLIDRDEGLYQGYVDAMETARSSGDLYEVNEEYEFGGGALLIYGVIFPSGDRHKPTIIYRSSDIDNIDFYLLDPPITGANGAHGNNGGRVTFNAIEPVEDALTLQVKFTNPTWEEYMITLDSLSTPFP